MMNNAMPLVHKLSLRDLVLWVHLGCTSEERAKVQEVRVSVEFRFKEMPLGTRTDQLEQTICYADVASAIQRRCENTEYNLIERMAFEIYDICRQIAGGRAELSVAVHKVRPPVERLLGGSHCQCGDF